MRSAEATMTSTWDELALTSIEEAIGRKYLDWPTVDEETVQLGESLAGAIGMVEGDMGNATADTARAVGNLGSLDVSDGLLEVFLIEGKNRG
jgi:hypothetical protein